MVPTLANMYKVFDNLHMLWMVIGSIIMPFSTTCVCPDLGIQLKSCVTDGLQTMSCAVVEALTQHEMFPTSPSNIYKVFDNLQNMLWMVIWIRYHAVTTT